MIDFSCAHCFLYTDSKLAQKALKLRNEKLSWVTNSIEHALKSCYPRKRYVVGWDAKFLFIPVSYLPSWVFDYIACSVLPKPAQAT